MKRVVAAFMSLFLIMTSLCFPVWADESESQAIDAAELSRDEIIELAIMAFPEYQAKISAFSDITPMNDLIDSSDIGSDPIIINETKDLSSNTYITFQQKASGVALISLISCGKVSSTSTDYGPYVIYSVNLHAICSISENTFLINGFKHQCTTSNKDSIINTGTLGGDVIFSALDTGSLSESGTEGVYQNYVAVFAVTVSSGEYSSDSTYSAYIKVNINNGSLTISGF